VASLTAFAINAATSVQSRWPLGLEALRRNPFRWSLLLTFVGMVVAAMSWRREPTRRGADGPPPPPLSEPPPWVVRRPVELDRVVASLRSGDGRAVGTTTALHGAGGFGKTTLASVVCADRRIRRRFGGRIYQVTLGRDLRGRRLSRPS
jgi:hypothetical protein